MTEIYNGLKAFIKAVVKPSPEAVYKSWQNRTSLDNKQNFAVISVLSSTRRGTNVRVYDEDESTETLKALFVHVVQVDFVGIDAAIQAGRLAAAFRDGAAVNFLADYGITPINCKGSKAAPFVLQSQWAERFIVELELSNWLTVELDLDSFDDVDLNIENVDVHHRI